MFEEIQKLLLRRNYRNISLFFLSTILVVIDQWTKYLVEKSLYHGERVVVIRDFFELTLQYNPGAAFSFLADAPGWQRWGLTCVGIVACAFLLDTLRTDPIPQKKRLFAIILILSGAIGNILDRIFRGAVVDFLLFHIGTFYWPAFNFADSTICIGAIIFVFSEIQPSAAKTSSEKIS